MTVLDVVNAHANTLVLLWIAIELRLAQPRCAASRACCPRSRARSAWSSRATTSRPARCAHARPARRTSDHARATCSAARPRRRRASRARRRASARRRAHRRSRGTAPRGRAGTAATARRTDAGGWAGGGGSSTTGTTCRGLSAGRLSGCVDLREREAAGEEVAVCTVAASREAEREAAPDVPARSARLASRQVHARRWRAAFVSAAAVHRVTALRAQLSNAHRRNPTSPHA